ncbi:hypothetical protein KEM60_01239 [Austwickia sp. TVS 96-490-7B]|uniref:L,D-transpeptidase family protein n=1 Tax=Austwickia sp. TVS 96-490-7B TaxID=2830843 RepID=UPI001C58CFAD|nr:L,D-transpeptidase family protein [Austwickia sp. TVS 96-490-7B]MBW3085047.1 hypothetical protein [Austwickia sp. TVS 96-490-7B]
MVSLSRRIAPVLAGLALALALPVGTSHALAPPPGPDGAPAVSDWAAPRESVDTPFDLALPVPYTGTARQLIVVRADCRSCTSASLQAWNVTAPGRGLPSSPQLRAKVGERGVGAAYEGSLLTPLGTWALTETFGIKDNPGTRMPYFIAGPHDYWDDDSDSPTYNTHVYDPKRPRGESLGDSGFVYNYAVVMGVNPRRVPYGGSGFFLHVSDGRPTLGCVAIGETDLKRIMQWLTPDAHPHMIVTL